MEDSKYTFWTLLQKYCIEIPTIQRDYAQGRENDKVNLIRRDFLVRLHQAICDDKPLNLDFIYGSTGQDNREDILRPLDGQQRLTTLFLLHWYLATRENCFTDENRSILSKFSYDTRPSSTDFCNRLVKAGIDRARLDGLKKLSEIIVDSNWFHASWQSDPTVKAMLVMLDAIHERFSDVTGGFEMLTMPLGQNPPITFLFLPPKKYGLTDDLYVRMNARGKPLTPFENFKAKFTEILEDSGEAPVNITENFSVKIDNVWTDLFWKDMVYREGSLAQAHAIDHYLMGYIVFITEMLYAQTVDDKETNSPFASGKPLDYEYVRKVYSARENIDFLISSLDFWSEVGNPPEWLNRLVSHQYMPGKIVLFNQNSNNAQNDLWTRCVTGKDFGFYEKILLFTITRRAVYLKERNADGYLDANNFARFARVVRNLLQTSRGTDYTGTIYDLSISFERLHNQLKSVRHLIEAQDVDSFLTTQELRSQSLPGFGGSAWEWEVKKAQFIKSNPRWEEQVYQLEDHPFLRGILVNLLDILEATAQESPNADVNIATDFSAIWELPDTSNNLIPNNLIVRAFLTAGDYSIKTGNTTYGERRYFGSPGKWNRILTCGEAHVSKCLRIFMEQYRRQEGSSAGRLLKMVRDYMDRAETGPKDWRYYFVKYEEMVTWKAWEPALAQNVFAWLGGYQMRMLKSSNLGGYHINPYIRAFAARVHEKNPQLCASPEGNYDPNLYNQDLSFPPFKIKKKGIFLECLPKGWKVTFENGNISESKREEMGLVKTDENYVYWLGEPNQDGQADREDRIQKAIKFIESLA